MAESATRVERYDFCLSFAARQRAYAEEVAQLLRAAGLRVFYDFFESADLLGVDLYAHLDEIYNRGSRYCVLFASEDYLRRAWTGHERVSAQYRAFRSPSAYVLPVRFDDTEIPGLRGTIGHADARVLSPAAVVRLLIAKLESDAQCASLPATVLVLAGEGRDDVLKAALERCGLTLPPELVLGSPARTVVVVPESVLPVVDVTTTLVSELETAAARRPGTRLRIAVHRGEVPTARLGGCVDVTAAAEAAVSSAVSEVFDARPRAHCVMVVTQRVYDQVIRHGRGGSNPRLYELVVTTDGTGLHVRVPGYPPMRRPSPDGRA
ncbi:TIR domain-containing protein [Amycolatopsis sp. OK19-0408]|uniref:TIR domain-containing protein n=1 Tax=Amycolatopsis iheyensis TaxID=2945988 RepID=A0A9X2NMI4_9PSEU|nr:TIR domain-containing protein [Amycolatopsis iheyensis]MCR6490416.1 TIR domain-containing protein [Amycolatopsis iheyensis]